MPPDSPQDPKTKLCIVLSKIGEGNLIDLKAYRNSKHWMRLNLVELLREEIPPLKTILRLAYLLNKEPSQEAGILFDLAKTFVSSELQIETSKIESLFLNQGWLLVKSPSLEADFFSEYVGVGKKPKNIFRIFFDLQVEEQNFSTAPQTQDELNDCLNKLVKEVRDDLMALTHGVDCVVSHKDLDHIMLLSSCSVPHSGV